MIPFIKICGITTAEAVEAAVAAGVNAIGFVFHAQSPRDIAPQQAAALAQGLPRSVLCVAVTLHPDQKLVDRVLAALLPDVWQSDAADFSALRIPATVERWPVLRKFACAPPGSRRVLFDSPASGSGAHADWPVAAVMAQRSELILGGGLDASNVGRAIATVRPFGVDVSSGVERAPGVKDVARIRDFVGAARAGKQAVRA